MLRNHLNVPYVKQFDSNGTLLNPINGAYLTQSLNREQRREKPSKKRINQRNSRHLFQEIVKFEEITVKPVFYPDGSIKTPEVVYLKKRTKLIRHEVKS